MAEKTLYGRKNALKNQIYGDLRIHRYDRKNWTIEEWTEGGIGPAGRGPDGWKIIGYYGKLKDLAVCLLDEMIVLSDDSATSGRQILQAITEAEERILAHLEGER
jgi:hypothetical protein